MDIFEVQSLIARRRILQPLTYDPTTAWLQVGLYQPGNRSNSASNANAYRSFAVRVSDLVGVSTPHLQNYLLVDTAYGNNLTAVKNDDEHPYQTIDAAIAAANPFDVIIVNPGDYLTFSNIHRPSGAPGTIKYYLRPGANWTMISPSGGVPGCPDVGTSLYIYGEGAIRIGVQPLAVSGDYSGEIVIECDVLKFDFGGFIGLFNTSYLASTTIPQNLSIKCRLFLIGASAPTGIMFALPWQVNVTAERLESTRSGSGAAGVCEFWQWNDFQNAAAAPVQTKSIFNIGEITKIHTFGAQRFMNIVGGNKFNEYYVNANIDYTDHTVGGTGDYPFIFHFQGNGGGGGPNDVKLYYNGVTNIKDAMMVLDQTQDGSKPFVQLKGKVYHEDTLAALFSTPYFIRAIHLELRNDTITSSANNNVVIVANNTTFGGQVDMVSSKIVSTDGTGLAPALISKFGASTSKLRLRDAYLISNGAPCILGAQVGGEPYEMYSAFASYAPINMVNALIVYDPINNKLVVDSNMTDNQN
jgi:hypothetical protein